MTCSSQEKQNANSRHLHRLTEEEKRAGMVWFQKDKKKLKRESQTALRNNLTEIGKEIQEVKRILVEFKIKLDMETTTPEVAKEVGKEKNVDKTGSGAQGKSFGSMPILTSQVAVL